MFWAHGYTARPGDGELRLSSTSEYHPGTLASVIRRAGRAFLLWRADQRPSRAVYPHASTIEGEGGRVQGLSRPLRSRAIIVGPIGRGKQ